MRKFVLTLLVALMVMPSMVCAMPLCMDEQQAAEPCHEMSGHSDSGRQNDLSGVMLLNDCMGTDLYSSDNASYNSHPDLSVDTIDFAWVDFASSYAVDPARAHTIRGPPPDVTSELQQIPVYLSTQRFRL